MKKKMLSLALAAMLALSAAACGKEDANVTSAPETTEATEAAVELDGSLTEIADQIYEAAGEMELAVAPSMELDLSDADGLKYATGLDSADDIEEAVTSDAMISAVAYSMVLVRVKDGSDPAAVMQEMLDGSDPRKWVCVTAEKTAVTSCGNVIMMVMADSAMADKICGAFGEVSEGSNTEPLTRIIEE